MLGGRPMVGLQTLDLAIGVRVPASQPKTILDHSIKSSPPDYCISKQNYGVVTPFT